MEFIAIKDVLFTFATEERTTTGREAKVNINSNSYDYYTWGNKNDLPTYREKMIMDNNIIGEMINTKRSIILGNGLMTYRNVYENGTKTMEPVKMPDEIQDWIDESDLYDKYLEPAANELFLHANIFASLMPLNDRISKIMVYKCRDIRARLRSGNNPIPGYVLSDWTKKKDLKSAIPAAMIPSVHTTTRTEFIIHTGDKLFNDGYYCHPAYWGGEEWIDLSNAIPKFHKANIVNGYSIRFHIEIPKNAFLNYNAWTAAKAQGDQAAVQKCIDDEQAKKTEFINNMNSLLAGEENSGRAVYTFFEHDDMGKKIEGVKINPIKFEMQDEALLKLFEKSNQANISAQGLHPTLANIESQGKLSSGSEMRNAFEFYIKIKARVPREIILKPLKYIWKQNGWKDKYPDLHLGFEDVVLTNLDDNPTGSQNVINPQNG